MTLRVSHYSWPPVSPDGSQTNRSVPRLPIIHIEGEISGVGEEAVRSVRGTVSIIGEGAVRWHLVCEFIFGLYIWRNSHCFLADRQSCGRIARRVVLRRRPNW